MMAYSGTGAPVTCRARAALLARAAVPDAEPAVVDAARVLTALWTAAACAGGEDAHVLHWLEETADLSAPRRVLAGHRPSGRIAALDLAAFDRARPVHRAAVRDIILQVFVEEAAA